ncbi:MAG: imidazole glycerol phosphate synthase subunit HisH [Candidatus Omnitrophica bacterium]|nr:imidazole glycerol phosphate synthase subunit HisH [Candidatus Omnitrophota bacterium]
MILVIDYGMGNLRSVSKALEHLGAQVKISSSPNDLSAADKIVLPGVGAFGDAVRELQSRGLFEAIQNEIRRGKKFLGICLGLQLLFSASEESPDLAGLSIYPGKVRRFTSSGIKIPHMGWNNIQIRKEHPVLKGVPDESFFYFVHSFYAGLEDPQVVSASCTYGKEEFCAIIGTENLFATQFHPEKSQDSGLTILKNFIEW